MLPSRLAMGINLDATETTMSSAIPPSLDPESFKPIESAQTRSRVAVFLACLASLAILTALWNMYMSYNSDAATRAAQPVDWRERIMVEERIKAWRESTDVNVSLLGLRVSGNDAAVLGAAVLLILVTYVFISARHVNAETAALLAETVAYTPVLRKRIIRRIASGMVLDSPLLMNPIASNGEINTALDRQSSRWAAILATILTHVPVIAIIAVIASDFWYVFLYRLPDSSLTTWERLTLFHKLAFGSVETFAIIAAIAIFKLCRRAAEYERATISLVESAWEDICGAVR